MLPYDLHVVSVVMDNGDDDNDGANILSTCPNHRNIPFSILFHATPL